MIVIQSHPEKKDSRGVILRLVLLFFAVFNRFAMVFFSGFLRFAGNLVIVFGLTKGSKKVVVNGKKSPKMVPKGFLFGFENLCHMCCWAFEANALCSDLLMVFAVTFSLIC